MLSKIKVYAILDAFRPFTGNISTHNRMLYHMYLKKNKIENFLGYLMWKIKVETVFFRYENNQMKKVYCIFNTNCGKTWRSFNILFSFVICLRKATVLAAKRAAFKSANAMKYRMIICHRLRLHNNNIIVSHLFSISQFWFTFRNFFLDFERSIELVFF